MQTRRIVGSCLAALTLTCTTSFAANIVFVSFHSGDNTPTANAATAGFTQAPDVGYTDLLTANGHTVTRYVTTGSPNTPLLNAADLVIISRSVPSGDYELDAETAAWNGITAPMIVLNGYLARASRLGFFTGSTIPDTTNSSIALTLAEPTHPIFEGIQTDAGNTMLNPYASRVIFNSTNLQRGISVITNGTALAGGGTILATVGTPNDPGTGSMIIGEWQAGSTMSTVPADILGGHRLVFLTGSRESGITSEGAGIFDLSPDGAQMFLNAVNYMAVPEPSLAALAGLGILAMLLRRRR